jgi:hypothetical protein
MLVLRRMVGLVGRAAAVLARSSCNQALSCARLMRTSLWSSSDIVVNEWLLLVMGGNCLEESTFLKGVLLECSLPFSAAISTVAADNHMMSLETVGLGIIPMPGDPATLCKTNINFKRPTRTVKITASGLQAR